MRIIFLHSTLGINLTSFEIGLRLPDDLRIGASTAAYQIEGAWNINGVFQLWLYSMSFEVTNEHLSFQVKARTSGMISHIVSLNE